MSSTAMTVNTKPGNIENVILPENYQRQIEIQKSRLDLNRIESIMDYCLDLDDKNDEIPGTIKKVVEGKDLGAVGDMLKNMALKLQSVDPSKIKLEDPSSKNTGLFGTLAKKIFNTKSSIMHEYEKFKAEFNNVVTSVESMASHFKQESRSLRNNATILDHTYKQNLEQYFEITVKIEAGKQMIQNAIENIIPDLQEKAKADGVEGQIATQRLSDINYALVELERKIGMLEAYRMIRIQRAPKLRQLQNGSLSLSNKIDTSLVAMIPLWKEESLMAMSSNQLIRSSEGMDAVTDMTNRMLIKGAENVAIAAITAQKSAERALFDKETILKTNTLLTKSITDVLMIQEQARQDRHEMAVMLGEEEGKLKTALLEATNRNFAIEGRIIDVEALPSK